MAIIAHSNRIAVNPLFSAWKSKSFTSNDIMLHFLILDFLADGGCCTADETADELQSRYGVLFDSQTVRKKLVEYESLGILTAKKEGRRLLYGKRENSCEENTSNLCSMDWLEKMTGSPRFLDMVSFYQGSAASDLSAAPYWIIFRRKIPYSVSNTTSWFIRWRTRFSWSSCAP